MSAKAATLELTSPERDRSLADLALTWTLAILTIGIVGVGAFLLTGGKALIVRSGSMAPAVEVGDLVVTRTVHPTDVEVGEIITFSDPTRDGILVTHRVRRIQRQGARIGFVTKGDANGGVERWTIARDGTVGRMFFSAPNLGYAVSWASEPATRIGLLVVGGLLLAYALLRRIWSS
jgi:signal peptidase I